MKVTVVGAGQVGLVAAGCLADFGLEVFCLDNNPQKISKLKKGEVPFYAAGLKEI